MRAGGHRVESLDAFRGLTIAGMILVNNPGNWDSVFEPLTHASWNGCTFADLVFPFFLFIMGAAMPFAFARRVASGQAMRQLHTRIVTRTLKLIALGLVLNGVAALPALAAMRIPGVLQRIALVYLVTALLYLHATPRTRAVVGAACLLGHWLLLALVPIGGAPRGMLVQGHTLAFAIDHAVFGGHLLTPTNDPEGLLGTLSAIATTLVGTFAGQWMRTAPTARGRVEGLIAGGAAVAALGLLWSRVLPLNKPLWTGSYALFTAGLAAITFALCFFAIDVLDVRGWARPFVWLGVNPLAMYFFSELAGHLMDRSWMSGGGQPMTAKAWIYFEQLEPIAGRFVADAGVSLLFAVAFVAVWVGVAGALYRRGIRLQV